jgi:hypothetical protein
LEKGSAAGRHFEQIVELLPLGGSRGEREERLEVGGRQFVQRKRGELLI